MKGMILAAGFGTRFRPITRELPKPMIPVCNRPLLGWAARTMVDAGIREIIVNLHHIPEPIQQYLSTSWNGEADFEFSLEKEILGTGGALRKVGSWLETEKTFALMNGDTIQQPPFERMRQLRESSDALATLLLRTPPEGDSFTDVWIESGRINQFGKGGEGKSLMFAGAHAMSPRILDLLPEQGFSGLTEDAYMPVTRGDGEHHLAGLVHDGLWFDVGKPTRYVAATKGILSAMGAGELEPPPGSTMEQGNLLHRTAEIEASARGSVIGERSRVSRGASLVDSIVWDDCTIGEGAIIENSIVAHGVRVPENARLINVTVCRIPAEEIEAGEIEATTIGEWLVTPVDSTRGHSIDL